MFWVPLVLFCNMRTSRRNSVSAVVHKFTYMCIGAVVHLPTYPIMTYSCNRCTVWCHIEARIAAQARLAADKRIGYGLSKLSPLVRICATSIRLTADHKLSPESIIFGPRDSVSKASRDVTTDCLIPSYLK